MFEYKDGQYVSYEDVKHEISRLRDIQLRQRRHCHAVIEMILDACEASDKTRQWVAQNVFRTPEEQSHNPNAPD